MREIVLSKAEGSMRLGIISFGMRRHLLAGFMMVNFKLRSMRFLDINCVP